MEIDKKLLDIDADWDGKEMYKLAECLYPICRSITGNGVRKTLSILKEIIPIEITEVPSGSKVFDWEIPNEWNIRKAWIKNSNGEKIVDFENLNLHVLNYSEPIDKKVNLRELKEHLYTMPEFPDWVPYRTSYYSRKWGFCISHKQFESLSEDDYQVLIDSEIEPGSLTYGEYLIPGQTKDEVLFSCHVCHPSLCNDNLSGIVLATNLAKQLRKRNLHYSYRFLFVPGTIGSITWLSKNEDKTKNIKHGLVLSLLGDSSPFHFKKSRQGDTEIDRIMEYILHKEKNSTIRDFSPYGYDERQFCSPGFNLPIGSLTRTPFGEFPEYHTSADNLNFISPTNLSQSLAVLFKAVAMIEGNRKWINMSPKCEPQLGKRGLYDHLGGGVISQREYQMSLLWILNLSDGSNSLLDIAIISKIDFDVLLKAAKDLANANLLA